MLNAFASGNLIYISLVEMVGVDFNAPEVQHRPRMQAAMFLFVCLGAGALALLAHWA